ncbi:MAG: hypothetical protein KAT43_01730 [Nanoarchaeota archaeon]|nr:hypothetical protein [Nanoarchaeota archaeon]
MLNEKRGQKRGQITIYIIIGLVILIVAGLVVYLAFLPEKEIRGAARESLLLPATHRPVQNFVEDCLLELSEEALTKLGAHGGWIDIEDPLVEWKEFDIDIFHPTNSDAVSLDPYGKNLVPYWWHMKSPFECYDCFATQENIPAIEDMEDQLNNYIERELMRCIQGFSELRKQGFEIEELKHPVAQAIVTDRDVVFMLDYPLKITKNDLEVKTKYFRIRQDVNLRRAYYLALQLTYDEIHSQRLENFLVMNLIGIFSGVDFGKLPPITSSTTGFVTVFWAKPQVDLMLKDLLRTYIPFLQVKGTAGVSQVEDDDPLVQGVYNSIFFEIWDEKYPMISVNYLYNDWPIDLEITPPQGPGLLKPHVYRTEYPFDILPPFQRNLYEFFYDVSFPVVIELYDSEAFNEKGFSFFIAHEANIKDNKNLLDWNRGQGTFYWEDTFMQLELDAGADHAVDFVNPITGEISQPETNISIPTRVKSLFGDPEQKIVNITINTYDKSTDEPLELVNILFGCGFYRTTSLGISQFQDSNKSTFTGKAPACVGDGWLELSSEDYETLIISNVSLKPGDDLELNAFIEPLRNQKIQFAETIHVVSSGDPIAGTTTTTTQYITDTSLKFYEEAVIILKRVKGAAHEREFTKSIILKNASAQTVQLIPGNYEISIMLMDTRGAVIWPEQRTYGSGDEEQTITIPTSKIELDSYNSGGVDYNNETCEYFLMTRSNLDADNILILKSMRFPTPVQIEDLMESGKISEYTADHCIDLQPEFI